MAEMSRAELDALLPGTLIYYRGFYDGIHHQLAEKGSDGVWYFYSDLFEDNADDDTHIDVDVLVDDLDITVLYRPGDPV